MESVLFIGKLRRLPRLVQDSVEAGHPTSVLVRTLNFFDPLKVSAIRQLRSTSAHFAIGKLSDPQSLVDAIKNVDVVVCVEKSEAKVHRILSAIRKTGNRKQLIVAMPGNGENREPFHNYSGEVAPVVHQRFRVPQNDGPPRQQNSFIGVLVGAISMLGLAFNIFQYLAV